MSKINKLFQNVPLWPNHGDVFHYDKFNISHSSETSSLPLEITLNHKVCLNINCLQFIYIWYLILGLYSNRRSIFNFMIKFPKKL